MSATKTNTATNHTGTGFRTLFWGVIALAAFGQTSRLWAEEEKPMATPTSWAMVMAKSTPALAQRDTRAVVAQADNPLRVRTSHK